MDFILFFMVATGKLGPGLLVYLAKLHWRLYCRLLASLLFCLKATQAKKKRLFHFPYRCQQAQFYSTFRYRCQQAVLFHVPLSLSASTVSVYFPLSLSTGSFVDMKATFQSITIRKLVRTFYLLAWRIWTTTKNLLELRACEPGTSLCTVTEEVIVRIRKENVASLLSEHMSHNTLLPCMESAESTYSQHSSRS